MTPISEVHNCDCVEFMKKYPDNFFSLAICDPPYNLKPSSVQGAGKLKSRVLNTGDMSWDIAPTQEYFDELFRVSKNQIIWGGNYFNLPPCRCFVCWDKVQPWENFSQCEFAWTSFDKPAKLFKFDNRSWRKWHSTGKPVELYAYLLKTFAEEGDTILDTHLGGGTSRIAAYKCGFDFYGCEINPEYFKIADGQFRAICLGEIDMADGKTAIQLELFD